MGFIEYIGSIGGIVGVLAYLIFLWNKSLIKQMREDRVFMEDRLSKLVGDYHDSCRNDQAIMIKHSEIMSELVTYLRRKNGNG